MINTSVAKMILGLIITAFIIITAAAAFTVNAINIDVEVVESVGLVKVKNEVAEDAVFSIQGLPFSELLLTYDIDENGLLNENEMSSSALQAEFLTIDADDDGNINEEEFNAYKSETIN